MAGPGQPVGGRLMGTGTCIALIAVGAILRFAITATSTHGVNVHVVGVIILLVGVLGLLLSLLVWSPLNPNRRRLAASDTVASPRIVRQYRRTYRDGRTYRDEPPPVVEEVSTYQDDPPR